MASKDVRALETRVDVRVHEQQLKWMKAQILSLEAEVAAGDSRLAALERRVQELGESLAAHRECS